MAGERDYSGAVARCPALLASVRRHYVVGSWWMHPRGWTPAVELDFHVFLVIPQEEILPHQESRHWPPLDP